MLNVKIIARPCLSWSEWLPGPVGITFQPGSLLSVRELDDMLFWCIFHAFALNLNDAPITIDTWDYSTKGNLLSDLLITFSFFMKDKPRVPVSYLFGWMSCFDIRWVLRPFQICFNICCNERNLIPNQRHIMRIWTCTGTADFEISSLLINRSDQSIFSRDILYISTYREKTYLIACAYTHHGRLLLNRHT